MADSYGDNDDDYDDNYDDDDDESNKLLSFLLCYSTQVFFMGS